MTKNAEVLTELAETTSKVNVKLVVVGLAAAAVGAGLVVLKDRLKSSDEKVETDTTV